MSTTIFDTNAKREEFTDDEWRLREEYFAELLTQTSHGACSSCAKARLTAKYAKKLHSLMESKKRKSQGAVAP